MWGGLIGLLFLAPIVGMAVGAASGALGGKMADVGVNDDFLKRLGAKLEPGGAAVIVLGQHRCRRQGARARAARTAASLIQTSLGEEQEGTSATSATGRWPVRTEGRGMNRERAVRTLTFWLRPQFVLRVLNRFQKVAGFDRAIALASGALTAMIPLMIVASSVASPLGGKGTAERIIDRYDLTGGGAEAVTDIFSPAEGTEHEHRASSASSSC